MTIVSLVLVVAGVMGPSVFGQNWLIACAFLGLFGPFLLRETGVMRWRDDFQREAVMRSGMHALVAVGLVLTLVLSVQGSGSTHSGSGTVVHQDAFPATAVAGILALTWGMSWLIQFWGTRRGACRLWLITVALITLLAVISNLSFLLNDTPMGARAFLMGWLQIAFGWALVFTSRRWPRLTGMLLLALAVVATRLVLPYWLRLGDMASVLYVVVAATIPLLVPGLALVFSREEETT